MSCVPICRLESRHLQSSEPLISASVLEAYRCKPHSPGNCVCAEGSSTIPSAAVADDPAVAPVPENLINPVERLLAKANVLSNRKRSAPKRYRAIILDI